jgi:hypothetical protein
LAVPALAETGVWQITALRYCFSALSQALVRSPKCRTSSTLQASARANEGDYHHAMVELVHFVVDKQLTELLRGR